MITRKTVYNKINTMSVEDIVASGRKCVDAGSRPVIRQPGSVYSIN